MTSIIRKLALFFLLVTATFYGCKQEIKVYRIGAVLPLSGEAEAYGQAVKNGLTLALMQVNEKGGLNGKNLDIFFEDDKSTADVAKQKTQQLIQQNRVPLVIGGVTSDVALAIGPICEQNKVILLSPSASSPKLSGLGNYVFRNYPSDTLEGRVMAEHAVRRMRIRSVAILYIDQEYGQGLREVFRNRFEELGGKVLYEKGYPEGATDFEEAVKEIKVAAPDAVYLPGYHSEIGFILEEIKDESVEVKILSSAGIASPRILEAAGEAAEGVVFPQPPYDPRSSEKSVMDFVNSYKKQFYTEPDVYAAYAFDALMIVAKAISETEKYPEALRDRLANVSGFQGVTGEIAFDAQGDVDITPRMFVVEGGQFRSM